LTTRIPKREDLLKERGKHREERRGHGTQKGRDGGARSKREKRPTSPSIGKKRPRKEGKGLASKEAAPPDNPGKHLSRPSQLWWPNYNRKNKFHEGVRHRTKRRHLTDRPKKKRKSTTLNKILCYFQEKKSTPAPPTEGTRGKTRQHNARGKHSQHSARRKISLDDTNLKTKRTSTRHPRKKSNHSSCKGEKKE